MTSFFGKPVEISIQSGSYDADVIAAGSSDKPDDQKKKMDQSLSYEIDKDEVKIEGTNEDMLTL